MDETEHPTLLSLLAAELGLSAHRAMEFKYQETGRHLAKQTGNNRFAADRLDERRWRRWKAGEVRSMSAIAAKILGHVFQRSADELLAPPPLGSGITAPPFVIDERELLMTAHDASGRASGYASQRLSDSTLEQVQDDVLRLARTYAATPPASLYLEARRLHSQVTTLLDQTVVPTQANDLHFSAGVVSALLAQVSFDLGSRQACTELARAARMHAEVIGHGPLQAFADCTMALVANWDGQPERAIKLIGRAYQFRLGGTGAVRRASIAARAFALVGDEESARRELAIAAESNRDEHDDLHDGVAGEFSFSEERSHMSAGSALLRLGDAPGAAVASGQALLLVQAQPHEKRSIKVLGEAAADQALAQLRSGDLDAAAASLEVVFAVPEDRRVDGLVQRVRPVQRALARPPFRNVPAARQMAEHLELFSINSVPQLLGQRPALTY